MISSAMTKPWSSDIYQPTTEELTGPSPTVDYVVIPYGQLLTNYQNRPWFSLVQAEAMLLDQQVWYGLQLACAPLLHAAVEVTSPSPEVAEFVQSHWDRFWRHWGPKVVQSKFFGYSGFEVNWCLKGDVLYIDRLRQFHPRDVGPLVQRGQSVQRGRIAGVGVRGQRYSVGISGESTNAIGSIPNPPTRLFGMNGLWTTYDAKYGSNFGRAITEKAYPAWWDKAMPSGAYDLRRLRGIKDAWIGDVVGYPLGHKLKLPDGTDISGKDMMREIMENRASGGGVYLPTDCDPTTGKELFKYQPPSTVAPSDIIRTWIEDLDWDIFDGLLIPREVVEAASSGSGFSGRSVPLVMFFSLRDMEFLEYVRAYQMQIAEPHVIRTLGQSANDFEMKPIPILDTWTEKISGMQVGGQVGGTTGGTFDDGVGAGDADFGTGRGGQERQEARDLSTSGNRMRVRGDSAIHMAAEDEGQQPAGFRRATIRLQELLSKKNDAV